MRPTFAMANQWHMKEQNVYSYKAGQLVAVSGHCPYQATACICMRSGLRAEPSIPCYIRFLHEIIYYSLYSYSYDKGDLMNYFHQHYFCDILVVSYILKILLMAR